MPSPLDTTRRMPPGILQTLLQDVRSRRITARMPAATLGDLLPDASPQPIVAEVTAPLVPRPPRAAVIAVSCAVTLAIGFTVIALV